MFGCLQVSEVQLSGWLAGWLPGSSQGNHLGPFPLELLIQLLGCLCVCVCALSMLASGPKDESFLVGEVLSDIHHVYRDGLRLLALSSKARI